MCSRGPLGAFSHASTCPWEEQYVLFHKIKAQSPETKDPWAQAWEGQTNVPALYENLKYHMDTTLLRGGKVRAKSLWRILDRRPRRHCREKEKGKDHFNVTWFESQATVVAQMTLIWGGRAVDTRAQHAHIQPEIMIRISCRLSRRDNWERPLRPDNNRRCEL